MQRGTGVEKPALRVRVADWQLDLGRDLSDTRGQSASLAYEQSSGSGHYCEYRFAKTLVIPTSGRRRQDR